MQFIYLQFPCHHFKLRKIYVFMRQGSGSGKLRKFFGQTSERWWVGVNVCMSGVFQCGDFAWDFSRRCTFLLPTARHETPEWSGKGDEWVNFQLFSAFLSSVLFLLLLPEKWEWKWSWKSCHSTVIYFNDVLLSVLFVRGWLAAAYAYGWQSGTLFLVVPAGGLEAGGWKRWQKSSPEIRQR